MIEAHYGDAAKGDRVLYEGRFVVTGSFIDATGRLMNLAEVLQRTIKKLPGAGAGLFATLRFPLLHGGDLDELHQQAIRQLAL